MSDTYTVKVTYNPTYPPGMRWNSELFTATGIYKATPGWMCFTRRAAERHATRYVKRMERGKKQYTYTITRTPEEPTDD